MIDEFGNAKRISTKCYRVLTTVLIGDGTSTLANEIFRSGSGPSFVRKSVHPTLWHANVHLISDYIRAVDGMTNLSRRSCLPDRRNRWKQGNHEFWLRTKIANKNDSLNGV